MFKPPWAHYLHVKAQKVIKYRAPLYTIFSYPFWYSLFKVKKKSLEPFLPKLRKSAILAQNLPLLGPKWRRGTFFQKSALFTFHHFWIPNFMPNFKKIVRAVFWENVLWMDIRKDIRTRVIL